jgi:uncharacterized repeat protein (TIGR03943 family)
MSTEAGGTAVLLVGVLLVRLVVTDTYQRFVQVAMGPWLLVAGVLLIGLGLVAVVSGLRSPVAVAAHGAGAHGDGDHHHGDGVGWLLLVPVLAVLLAPPPALGSYGVDRSSGVTVTAGGRTYAPLAAPTPTRPGPYPMALREFGERAVDAGGASFAGNPVELTGFVARPDDTGGFRLARFQISCCAADAVAAVVRVYGVAGLSPVQDAWLTVIGTFRGVGADGVPELDAVAALPVDAPVDPYEE